MGAYLFTVAGRGGGEGGGKSGHGLGIEDCFSEWGFVSEEPPMVTERGLRTRNG